MVFWMCECPRSILDNLNVNSFQHTCVNLLTEFPNTCRIWCSGRNFPLHQLCKCHSHCNETVLFHSHQIIGRFHKNTVQTLFRNLYSERQPFGNSHTEDILFVAQTSCLTYDPHCRHDKAYMRSVCCSREPVFQASIVPKVDSAFHWINKSIQTVDKH